MDKMTLLACLCLLTVGCAAPFNLTTLQPEPTPRLSLPPLEAELDPLGFRQTMALQPIEPAEADGTTYVIPQGQVLNDQRYLDTYTLFRREVSQLWSGTDAPARGRAVCRLAGYNEVNRGWGFSTLTLLSVGLLNVVGLPHARYLTQVELEVELYDTSGRRIGRYTGRGNVTQLAGLYYGRTNSRARYVQVAREALLDIRRQLLEDQARLTQALY